MKKIIVHLMFIVVASCNTGTTNGGGNGSDTANVTYDVTEADTTIRSDGMSNSEPVSIDTGAYKINDTTGKKDSSK